MDDVTPTLRAVGFTAYKAHRKPMEEDLTSQIPKMYDILDSFGIKTYDDCGYFTGDVENANLYKAVNNELQTNEIKFINDYLKKRGITYQF